jgi:hypothetical protein
LGAPALDFTVPFFNSISICSSMNDYRNPCVMFYDLWCLPRHLSKFSILLHLLYSIAVLFCHFIILCSTFEYIRIFFVTFGLSSVVRVRRFKTKNKPCGFYSAQVFGFLVITHTKVWLFRVFVSIQQPIVTKIAINIDVYFQFYDFAIFQFSSSIYENIILEYLPVNIFIVIFYLVWIKRIY